MRMCPGWGWLLLPVCRALLAPKEVSGRVGETLSVQCWYSRGYEQYNKYWCRGASRDSCRKVVETAGPKARRQRGRVSISDNHVFCVILLTVEDLSEEDAGSYWCGIERLGRDLMEPVEVAVFPALPATSAAPPTTPTAQTPVVSTVMNGTELLITTNVTTPGSPRPALSIMVPSVVLASLLAAIGSAVLIRTLVWRRKEALQRPLGEASSSRQHKPVAGWQVPGEAPSPRSTAQAAAEGDGGAAGRTDLYSNCLTEGSESRRAAGALQPRPPHPCPPLSVPRGAQGPGDAPPPPPPDELLYANAPRRQEAPGSYEETEGYWRPLLLSPHRSLSAA